MASVELGERRRGTGRGDGPRGAGRRARGGGRCTAGEHGAEREARGRHPGVGQGALGGRRFEVGFHSFSKTFEDFRRLSQHFFDVCYVAPQPNLFTTNELLIAHGGTLGTAHRWVPCGLLTPRLGWQHRVVTVRMRWAGSFGSGVCLDDAVPESERQYIQDDQGRR